MRYYCRFYATFEDVQMHNMSQNFKKHPSVKYFVHFKFIEDSVSERRKDRCIHKYTDYECPVRKLPSLHG